MLKMHATLDKLFNQMWNMQKIDLVDELLAQDFHVYYSGGSVSTHADFKKMLREWFVGFPDLYHTVEDYVEVNDKISVRWQGIGTHQGIYQSIYPTNRKLHYEGITFFHLDKAGKIIAAWVAMDLSDRLQELASDEAQFK